MTSDGHRSRIEAAQQGDQGALEALIEKYRPVVLDYVRLRGLPDQAEDLAQEVFLRLSADPATGSFRDRILTLTRDVLSSHLKHGVASPEELASFDREWLARLLELGLERLAQDYPHYHRAMLLLLIERLTPAQVAKRLQVSPDVVHVCLQRGKLKLLAFLHDEVWNYSVGHEAYEQELARVGRYLPSSRAPS